MLFRLTHAVRDGVYEQNALVFTTVDALDLVVNHRCQLIIISLANIRCRQTHRARLPKVQTT
jgi:hypothetical protein